jgi:hypothetical protein
MKAILAIVGLVVVLVAVYLVLQWRAIQQAATGPAKEIVSESIAKSGDTWHVKFVSKIDAPLDRVFEAFQHPERLSQYAPENALKSEIVNENGNTKVVDVVGRLDILPPGFKVQNLRTEYTVYPDEHRITSRSVDFKLADINSEYRFEPAPDGKATIVNFTQTSKDKAPMLVDSLQKGALRETYVTQVRAVNRALGLAPTPEKRQAS